MKLHVAIFLIILTIPGYAQRVAINTDGSSPHSSAMLDIKSTTRGVLIPRMTLAQRNGITGPTAGLIIYQTDNSPGFYYHTGSAWTSLVALSATWAILGNTGTNPAIHFLGTTDNQPLRLRLNNKWAGELNASTGTFFLGDSTGISNSGSGNTAFGSKNLRKNTTGYNNTASGHLVLFSNTIGHDNTATGVQALRLNTVGNTNTAVGAFTLYSNLSGGANTAVGASALVNNTNGNNNTGIGYSSLFSNAGGGGNVAVGPYALYTNSSGSGNTAQGDNALYSNVGGSSNTASGSYSLYKTTGSFNTAVGTHAMYENTSGNYNTALGDSALYYNVTGTRNIAIGSRAGTNTSYTNTISLGNHGYLNGASNQIMIGNLSSLWNGGNVAWSTYSDERIKTNITEEVIGLDFIMRLRPVTYFRDIDKQSRLTGNEVIDDYPGKYDIEQIQFSGFLAQEVEQAAKTTGYQFSGIKVPKTETDLYTLSYESFVVPLVKAVQELAEETFDQKKVIKHLEASIASLEQRLAILEDDKPGIIPKTR